MKKNLMAMLATLAAVFAADALAGGIYKTVLNGKTTYSDIPSGRLVKAYDAETYGKASPATDKSGSGKETQNYRANPVAVARIKADISEAQVRIARYKDAFAEEFVIPEMVNRGKGRNFAKYTAKMAGLEAGLVQAERDYADAVDKLNVEYHRQGIDAKEKVVPVEGSPEYAEAAEAWRAIRNEVGSERIDEVRQNYDLAAR